MVGLFYGIPLCVTVNVRPAMVNVDVLEDVPALSDTK